MVAATLALQVAVGSIPVSAAALGLVPLRAAEWLVALGLGVVPVAALEAARRAASGRL